MKFFTLFNSVSSPFYFHWEGKVSLQKAKKCKAFMILVFLLLFSLFLSFHVFHLFYYNSTPSAPRGFYMVSPISTLSTGDYVIVECPKDYPPLTNKGRLLLKEVEGFPGDTFEITTDFLIIHDRHYPIYHSPSYLPQLPQGTFTVPANMYLFLNPMPYSFDSRYMGPIAQDKMVRKVFLVFNTDNALHKLVEFRKEFFQ